MLMNGQTDEILSLVAPWTTKRTDARYRWQFFTPSGSNPRDGKVNISHEFFSRSPRLVGNGRCLRRWRSRLARPMQFAICSYEELAERKGRFHHRRIDGDWSCLSARTGRRGCTTLHHWATRARDRRRRTCNWARHCWCPGRRVEPRRSRQALRPDLARRRSPRRGVCERRWRRHASARSHYCGARRPDLRNERERAALYSPEGPAPNEG